MAIAKITAWRTSNGEIFDNEGDARSAENRLSIIEGISALVCRYGWRNMAPDEIVDMLFDYRDEFSQALKGVQE